MSPQREQGLAPRARAAGLSGDLICPEEIPFPAAGEDQRQVGALVDLVAEVTDVDIDHVGVVAVVVAVARTDRVRSIELKEPPVHAVR